MWNPIISWEHYVKNTWASKEDLDFRCSKKIDVIPINTCILLYFTLYILFIEDNKDMYIRSTITTSLQF